MKLRTLGLCKAALLLVASLFVVTAEAEIVENDVVIVVAPNPDFGPLWLTLNPSPQSMGQGLFAFSLSGVSYAKYLINAIGIAEAYGLYSATQGDVIDASFRASHTPIAANFASGTNTVTFKSGETKLFAFWDAGFGPRPETYGWVNLSWTEYGLTVSSSARALGSGIIAGTTTAVPEPHSAALFLLGGAAMGLVARLRRPKATAC